MPNKRSSRLAARRISLYVLTAVFSIAMIGQDAQAFDKSYASGNDIEFYQPCGTDPNVDADSTSTPSEYITNGKIPKEGLVVGASVFGGKQQGGKWVADWADNNGNDLGNHGNHLTGTTSFAELTLGGSLGNALGNIENGSKIEITYGGKKIIAEKGDVGTGGGDVSGTAPAPGKNISTGKDVQSGDRVTVGRGVDLWYETANVLGFGDGTGVITVHAVDKNTPTTPINGKPTANKDDSSSTASNNGTCCNVSQAGAGDGTLVGKTNEQKIWNFLTGRDGNIPMSDALSPEQAAGVMGNLKAESSYRPEALQKGGDGFGIAQWSYGRRDSIEAAAKKQNVSKTDLAFQLKYLYEESKSRTQKDNKGNEWAGLRQQKTVEDAVFYWEHNFERSGDSKARVVERRGGFAREAYNNGKKLGTGTVGAPAAGGESKQVIFLDPGHGGNLPDYTDKKTGLITNETNNGQEDKDVLEVANKIKTELEKQGYKVEMSRTKNNLKPSDNPTFRERADMAAKANASIGISLHTSPGGPNDAWSQKVGTFRELKNGSHHTTFKDSGTAGKSQEYAKAIASARSDAEGHKVGLDADHAHQTASFGRGGNIKSPGNIPMIALFSAKVPWVYNEIEQDKGTGLSNKRKEAYAKGIVNGIVEALPPVASGCDSAADSTGLNGLLSKYAWPNRHQPLIQRMPDYTSAVKKAMSEGKYVGLTSAGKEGVDCGGFVTLLLTNSGFEPKYNSSGKGGPTGSQEAWLQKNWQSLGNAGKINTSKLSPGDVAIYDTNGNGHTFVYIGKGVVIDDKGTKFGGKTAGFTGVASASMGTRAPMAGIESLVDAKFTWYHKK